MQKNIIKNSFKYSLERSVPILIGFFPVGTVYGLSLIHISLLANPKSLLLGAAAQLGVFLAFFGAVLQMCIRDSFYTIMHII